MIRRCSTSAQQAENGTAEGGEDLGDSSNTYLRVIFIKGDITDPMTLGLNVPMLPHVA